ncbi:flagellar basal body-associated FliL family protein [Edaphobacter albus]|uniref:flagellar basal body-associated FliL family protein n=1 Tax=Edaphobacter sp. 4G125 TaxID=2763071 RepID=UPI00164629A3|nr:flagellar basal body-associated FliL family protein [Edaphobacter sp. 4G125]QNI35273.1 flagellar basal body-associated FliL family protein [Edaphobacter sp. 4G125]
MATTPPVIQAKITSDPVKIPFFPLLITVVIGVAVATASVGGVVYYLLRSGKLSLQREIAVTQGADKAKSHLVVLEPLLVNLADSSGTAYLRAGITLQVADSEPGTGSKKAGIAGTEKEADVAIRDTALTVLGKQTSDQLLAVGGKERLKNDLKTALAERNTGLKVVDLFFTEFLVQR